MTSFFNRKKKRLVSPNSKQLISGAGGGSSNCCVCGLNENLDHVFFRCVQLVFSYNLKCLWAITAQNIFGDGGHLCQRAAVTDHMVFMRVCSGGFEPLASSLVCHLPTTATVQLTYESEYMIYSFVLTFINIFEKILY